MLLHKDLTGLDLHIPKLHAGTHWPGGTDPIVGLPVNIQMFGAVGDGVTDDTIAIQAAITATPVGGKCIVLPTTGGYKLTATLVIDHAMTLEGIDNASLSWASAVSGTAGISVSASDVTIAQLTLTGRGNTSQVDGEIAIGINVGVGGTWAAALQRIFVTNVTITSWGDSAILGIYLIDFHFDYCTISHMGYHAIAVESGMYGTICHNRITDISPGKSGNAYGVIITRISTASLATNPVSESISCSWNIIDSVPLWEGLDTHAGKHLEFISNRISNCMVGIVIIPDSNSNMPSHCIVMGNTITDGASAASVGINLTGDYEIVKNNYIYLGVNLGYSGIRGFVLTMAIIEGNYLKNANTGNTFGILLHTAATDSRNTTVRGNVFDGWAWVLSINTGATDVSVYYGSNIAINPYNVADFIANQSLAQISFPNAVVIMGDPAETYLPTAQLKQFSESIYASKFQLSALNTAPANAGATGTLGEIRITANGIYVCTATNTWGKTALATWT